MYTRCNLCVEIQKIITLGHQEASGLPFGARSEGIPPPGGREISNAEANKAMKRREKGLLMKRKRKMRCCQKQIGLRYK